MLRIISFMLMLFPAYGSIEIHPKSVIMELHTMLQRPYSKLYNDVVKSFQLIQEREEEVYSKESFVKTLNASAYNEMKDVMKVDMDKFSAIETLIQDQWMKISNMLETPLRPSAMNTKGHRIKHLQPTIDQEMKSMKMSMERLSQSRENVDQFMNSTFHQQAKDTPDLILSTSAEGEVQTLAMLQTLRTAPLVPTRNVQAVGKVETINNDVKHTLYTNMKVLSSIADLMDAYFLERMNMQQMISVIRDSHDTIYQSIDRGFDSIGELYIQSIALETDAASKKMITYYNDMKHHFRMHKLNMLLDKNLACMSEEEDVQSDTKRIGIQLKKGIDEYELMMETEVDSWLLSMNQMNEYILVIDKALRELEFAREEMISQAQHSRTKILADAERERTNERVDIDKIRILGEEGKRTALSFVRAVFHHIESALKHVLTKDGQYQVYLLTVATTVLVFSVLLSKELVHVLFSLLKRFLSTPRLVRYWGRGPSKSGNLLQLKLPTTVLPMSSETRVLDFITSMNLASKRQAPCRNILLYGPSGCGKSLLAREIAQSVNRCAYCVMSGADLIPLGEEGPAELQKVIMWAKRGQRHGVVIIDDAECAFKRRVIGCERPKEKASSDHSSSCDILNMFLSMTGDTAGDFSFILTTSNPNLLDEAILDRCDEVMALNAPLASERYRILRDLFNKSFEKQKNSSCRWYDFLYRRSNGLAYDDSFDVEATLYLLSKTEVTGGMSGRELSMIIKAVKVTLHSSDDGPLTASMWEKVVGDVCSSMKMKAKLKTSVDSQ